MGGIASRFTFAMRQASHVALSAVFADVVADDVGIVGGGAAVDPDPSLLCRPTSSAPAINAQPMTIAEKVTHTFRDDLGGGG